MWSEAPQEQQQICGSWTVKQSSHNSGVTSSLWLPGCHHCMKCSRVRQKKILQSTHGPCNFSLISLNTRNEQKPAGTGLCQTSGGQRTLSKINKDSVNNTFIKSRRQTYKKTFPRQALHPFSPTLLWTSSVFHVERGLRCSHVKQSKMYLGILEHFFFFYFYFFALAKSIPTELNGHDGRFIKQPDTGGVLLISLLHPRRNSRHRKPHPPPGHLSDLWRPCGEIPKWKRAIVLTPHDLQPTFKHAVWFQGAPTPRAGRCYYPDPTSRTIWNPERCDAVLVSSCSQGSELSAAFSEYLVCHELCSLFWNMWFRCGSVPLCPPVFWSDTCCLRIEQDQRCFFGFLGGFFFLEENTY